MHLWSLEKFSAVDTSIAALEATPMVGAVPAMVIPLDTPQTDVLTPVIQEAPGTPLVKEVPNSQNTEIE